MKREVLKLPHVKAQKALQDLSIGPSCSPLRFWQLAALTLQQQNVPYSAEQLNAMAQVVMSTLNDQLSALDGQQVMVQYFADKVFSPFVDKFRAAPASDLWELGERLLVIYGDGTQRNGSTHPLREARLQRRTLFRVRTGVEQVLRSSR